MKYQLIWINLIRKIVLYQSVWSLDDQRDQTSSLEQFDVIWFEFKIKIIIEFHAQKYQDGI